MTLRLSAKLAAAALAVAMAAPALAQDDPPRNVRDSDPDAKDVVMTPVDDLNLDGDEIPEVLDEARMDPYASEKLAACEDITREISRLDAVLGPDYDLDPEERSRITAGDIGKTVVKSFIPFRGLLREVTGAADEERDLRDAIVAGGTRRGYLKGLGEARGCAYPARPAMVTVEVDESAEVIDLAGPRAGN